MSDFPVVVTQGGAQPTPVATLYERVISHVEARVPDYTANLPPALITDLASTATGAIAVIDQAMVDLINSVNPYGANIPMLIQLGHIYGVTRGVGSNTSVYVLFSGNPGFIIPRGFLVTDGNHQYVVQNNSIIPASGQSLPVWCLADEEGSWAVPAGTVTEVLTSVPGTMVLTCTNTEQGIPGTEPETEEEYRTRVMRAGMLAVQGTPDTFKSRVFQVEGVVPRLVSYRQVNPTQWVAIVGGGDPYQVAQAIYESVPDISVLTTSVNNPSGSVPHAEVIDINDYPDWYQVGFLVPDSQSVTVILTWNTSSLNYVDPGAIATVATPVIVDYINSIYVGKPINIYQLQTLFMAAVSNNVNPALVSLVDIEIAIDGTVVPPDPNSGLVSGDLYKYFTTDASHVIVRIFEGA